MPYKAKGKCVYKADTGKKVGCTKGPVSKYLAALYANVPDAKNESKTTNTIPAGPAPTGDKLNKVIQHLAKKAEEWKNYKGLDSPDEITYVDFLNFIIDDPKISPAVKKFWYSLKRGNQDQIFNKVIDVLYKKYGSDDDMYENINLSEIAEKVVEANKPAS